MKKLLTLYLAILLAGCATVGGEEVKNIVTDPHFAAYQKNLDDLESSHLKGEMNYVDYLKKKKQLEDDYNRGVKVRENIITNTTPENLAP